MSIRINLVPEQELPDLHTALAYYRFESINQFVRVACRALMDHHRQGDELLSPLRFKGWPAVAPGERKRHE